MATIRLVNPRRRNLRPKGGVLTLMTKNKRSRRRRKNRVVRHRARTSNAHKAVRRRRRSRKSNPVRRRRSANLHIRRRRGGKRRNPAPGMGQLVDLLVSGLFAIFGGVIARSVPEWFLAGSNVGIQGYLYNMAVTIAEWYLAHSVGLSADHATAMGIGGSAFTASRIIEDYFGSTTLTFPSVSAGGGMQPAVAATPNATLGAYGKSDVAFSFSRRPRFGMRGVYQGSDFVIPTESLNVPTSGLLPAAGQTQGSSAASASPATANGDMWSGAKDIWG